MESLHRRPMGIPWGHRLTQWAWGAILAASLFIPATQPLYAEKMVDFKSESNSKTTRIPPGGMTVTAPDGRTITGIDPSAFGMPMGSAKRNEKKRGTPDEEEQMPLRFSPPSATLEPEKTLTKTSKEPLGSALKRSAAQQVTHVPRFGNETKSGTLEREGHHPRIEPEHHGPRLVGNRLMHHSSGYAQMSVAQNSQVGSAPPPGQVAEVTNEAASAQDGVQAVSVRPAPSPGPLRSLPRYRGGAPPIAFTVVNTGERVTLPGGTVGEGVAKLSGIQVTEDIFETIQQAKIDHKAGKTDKAIKRLHEALLEHDGNAVLWAALGELYLETGQYREAVSAYKEASSLWNSKYQKRYAEALVLAGEDETALPLYEALAKANTDDPETLYTLGTLYQNRKEYEKAVLYLTRAAKFNESSPDIHYNLGLAFEQMGNKEKARLQYMRALELSPSAEDVTAALKRLEISNL